MFILTTRCHQILQAGPFMVIRTTKFRDYLFNAKLVYKYFFLVLYYKHLKFYRFVAAVTTIIKYNIVTCLFAIVMIFG